MNENQIKLITQIVTNTIANSMKNSPDRAEITMNVPVGVSARHIHCSQMHLEELFGTGYVLRPKKELMGRDYAAEETVAIFGKDCSLNARVLGPVRKQTQVEISATDARRLGISPPVKESGDLDGSAPVTIIGPKGAVRLDGRVIRGESGYCADGRGGGCIIASRHIHAPPGCGLADGDIVSVRVKGERGLIFDNVKVRVDKSFRLEMHIDTDEANASGLKSGDMVELLGVRKRGQ